MLAGAATLTPNPKGGHNAFTVTINFVEGMNLSVKLATQYEYSVNWFGHAVTHTADGSCVFVPLPPTFPFPLFQETLSLEPVT